MNVLVLISLFTSPIIFLSYTIDEFEQPKTLAMNLCMLAILGVVLTTTNIRTWSYYFKEITKDLTCLGFLCFLLSSVIYTIFSISPRTSILGNFQSYATLLTFFSYTVLFFTLREFCKRTSNVKNLTTIGLAGGAVTAVYSVIQMTHFDPSPWRNFVTEKDMMRPFGTMGHPNFMSAYLVMLLPFVMLRRRLRYVLVPLFIFCIIASGSRAALCALFATFGVLAYGLLKTAERRKIWLYTGLLCAVLCLCYCGFICLPVHSQGYIGALQDRARSLFKLDTRAYYWVAGLKIFKKYPFFGSGLDTYQIMFNQLRTEHYWQVEKGGAPHKAHNEFIQILATQGLFGVFSICLIALGVIKNFIGSWRNSLTSEKSILIALMASCVGFIVQALAGFNVVACGGLFVSNIAMLVGFMPLRPAYDNLEQHDGKSFVSAIAIGTVISSIILFMNLGSMFGSIKDNAALIVIFSCLLAISLYVSYLATGKLYFRSAAVICILTAICFRLVMIPFFSSVVAKVGVQNSQDKKLAITALEQAIRIDQSNEDYASRLGYLAEQAGVSAKDPTEANQNFILAFNAFQYASKLEPLRAANWYNQALLMAELIQRGVISQDQVRVAYPMLLKAIELEPNNPVFKTLLANGTQQPSQKAVQNVNTAKRN